MSVRATSGHHLDHVTLDILDRIADLTGRDADALPPIYESIDPDVFGLICDNPLYDDSVRIRFEYCGHVVSVAGDGTVGITPADEYVGTV